jgi:hypothetical protein
MSKKLTDEQKAELDKLAAKNPELEPETSKAWQQLMVSVATAWRQEAAKLAELPGTEKTVALIQRIALTIEQTAQRGPAKSK